jgi:hypothetical protein
MQCPYRKMLKRKYDEWQAAREHKKFAEEYPNDV